MNRQFRTANNGKVAICRPFRTRIPFLSPPRIFIYIYMYTYTHAHLKPNCWLIIHSSAVVRFVRVAGSIITGQASVASAQLFDSAALNRSSPLFEEGYDRRGSVTKMTLVKFRSGSLTS